METVVELGPGRAAELDARDMLGAIASLPRQLTVGYAAACERLTVALASSGASRPPPEPTGLVVCGMGGSAIGADLVLACLPSLPVPATVVRGYVLPAWVTSRTLAVAMSYSGETEEALACVEQAGARGCTPICIASGGRLAALAGARGWPCVPLPPGAQPRASVGYLSMSLLAAIEAAGLCSGHADEVADAAALLRADNEAYGIDQPESSNQAKQLARKLARRLGVVYGAGPTASVARRWKGQLNENAKAPAFFNELPELDHNEIMGWTSLPHVSSSALAVFLTDGSGDPRLTRRVTLTAAAYDRLGVATEQVAARGSSCLARVFSLVQLGDYISYYVALLHGVDPTPVGAIQDLKDRLVAGGG